MVPIDVVTSGAPATAASSGAAATAASGVDEGEKDKKNFSGIHSTGFMCVLRVFVLK